MSKTLTKIIAGLGIVGGIGVAALPLTSYANNPQEALVQFTINPTLGGNESICGQTTGGISPTTLDGGTITAGGVDEVECQVQYSANSAADITLVDSNANNDLIGTNNSANTIPSYAANANLATLPAGTEGWGFKFASVTAGAASGGLAGASDTANYNGIPLTTPKIIGTNTQPVSGAQGTIYFGVSTATTTEADIYRDTVTIQVTARV